MRIGGDQLLAVSACLVLSALCGGHARAATYYVDDSGNNSNTGLSPGAAWLTIQHAVDTVSPGDEIIVLAGAYAGARIESSGTSSQPITLRAAAGADVWITAPGPSNRHNSNLELEVWDGDWVVRHWIIEGLIITNAPAWGIDARSTQHITIRSNTVIDSGVTGIFTAFCYDTTIEGNHSHHNGEHGIYHNNSSDRFVIRGNRCHDNANAGIHMNGDLSNPVPPGAPWTLDGLISHGLIEDNLIYNNGPGGAAINMDGVTYTMVRNNVLVLSYNNSGIALFQQNGAEPSHNNQILHNTIGMRSSGGWAINLTQAGCVSNTVYNNIATTDHSWRGSIMIATPNLVGFESDYNIVMDRFSTDAGGTRITFNQWKALGYDQNSIIATPSQLYQDIWQNFHLLASAPAIDAGTVMTSVWDDVELRARPLDSDNNGSSLPDIGAYERLHTGADSDGDGIPDWEEGHIGINPADDESVFVVSDIEQGPGPGQVVLKWPSVSGVFYKVRRSTNMPPLLLYGDEQRAGHPAHELLHDLDHRADRRLHRNREDTVAENVRRLRFRNRRLRGWARMQIHDSRLTDWWAENRVSHLGLSVLIRAIRGDSALPC